MQSGSEMEAAVREVIANDIISVFNKAPALGDKKKYPEDLPVAILRGLYEVVSETGITGLISCMFDYSFPTWVRKYHGMVMKEKKLGVMLGNDPIYDEIIKLLSVSVTEEEGDPHVERVLD